MKVCLINNVFLPYTRGGADRVVRNIADGLLVSKHDVFIITTKKINFKQAETGYRVYYIKSLFLVLDRLPKFFRLFWHMFDLFNFCAYFRIRKIIKKEKPDMIMTHNLKGLGYLIPKLAKTLKIKHIHTLHDLQLVHPSGLMFQGEEQKLDSLLSKVYFHLCAWLFQDVRQVISPSNWILKEHEKRGFFRKADKQVVPNPIKVINIKKEKTLSHDKKNFLYVGELEIHKGVLFLLEAFQDLGEEDARLIIVGKGSLSDNVFNISKKSPRIDFLGSLDNHDVIRQMEKADCLIMPSFCYENSPTVLYEALLAGLPAIASNIGGIPEIIKQYGGILFEPKNKNDLISKIKMVIGNKKISLNTDKAKTDFKLDEYIKKITA